MLGRCVHRQGERACRGAAGLGPDGAGAARPRHRVRRRESGSSFEGIQESLINYGNPPNVMPEFITALHEESAVTMAHGYGKATGKPMCALLHGTIGIQHAAMSIYQAYYDKTPALLIAGAISASSPRTARTTWPAWSAATPSGTRRRRRSRNRSSRFSVPTTKRSRRRALRRWS
jgi:hypothetical protein